MMHLLPILFSCLIGYFFKVDQATSMESSTEARKPNVIFILSDDQGSVDLGIYGTSDIQTPNLDRMAARGVRFTQFYAGAPICSPSRASILTGKTPVRAGVPGNVASIPNQQKGMPASEVTIAEMLKGIGYKTAAIGKWHLGYSEQLQPNGQGFDYFFGHLVGCIDNFSHFYYWRGPNRHDLYRNGKEIHLPDEYFPDLMLQEACSFMEKNQEDPFFIYYALNTPHYPYQGDPEWLEYYNQKKVPYPRNLYNAFVSTMDDRIGRLWEKVEQLALAENTIIIFQSDHGHSTEERAHFGGGNAGKYRGAKGSLFEGGLRVPAFISWPGQIPEGEVRAQMAVAPDWLPTLADLCGAAMPNASLDGKSLVPILKSNAAPENHEVFHWTFQKRWAIRKGKWKLLYDPIDTTYERNPEPNAEDDLFFLVNLEEDVGEKRNLAKTYPNIVKELNQLHQAWINRE